ncbi:MAG: CoA transferase, partial [Candidatus Nitrotoga sp.]
MNHPAEAAATQVQALPLSRITVLDLTLARAGPTCVRHLADWGANIIRIEPPDTGGEDVSGKRDGFDFQNLHRNKKFLQLNLKTPEGHAAFMKLAEKADVVILVDRLDRVPEAVVIAQRTRAIAMQSIGV